ncbi:class I SAM-dependent methyltransferase [Caldicellulosiruptor naganoensis]|uniref:Class I SAM-dependent methyltransferase n=1 Tax=Caldicellulosiruptor naganoensis TaxID=29324 RepID=A0ABY7BJ70_9FIRM|nr:class I SAM-dependent methyltransferase [Caldicellulosiruptor naganoensis]WAM32458.1 class I SAM-dependent methyltransferase [Caldicellulosiruptor naganoensis]
MDTREYFNLLADKWDEIVWHDPQKINQIMQLISLKKGEKVLDVGTGTGVFLTLSVRRSF